MLKQRMKKKVLLSRGAKAQTLFDELNLNQKTRLELEKQNVQWDSIDAQVLYYCMYSTMYCMYLL
jgi:hypothetical protein